MKEKTIILLSGGLDSTTTLYYAKQKGYDCHALIFNYGQRHAKEIKAAVEIANLVQVPYQILKIDFPWKGSALTDSKIKVPSFKTFHKNIKSIPVTYVPGRNTIFLSFALSYAEAIKARFIFIGANAIDYSGYPDCRPGFFKAFRNLIKKGARNKEIQIKTPLIKKTKPRKLKWRLSLVSPWIKPGHVTKAGKKLAGRATVVCCVIRRLTPIIIIGVNVLA